MVETQIITEGYPEDNQIIVDEVTIKYYQPPDCTEDREGDGQEIVLSTRNNGIAKFVNIRTNNWSISGIEDLQILIKDFEERSGIKKDVSNSSI